MLCEGPKKTLGIPSWKTTLREYCANQPAFRISERDWYYKHSFND